MTLPPLYTNHGIDFIDPASVKQAKKDRYWLHTGFAMQEKGLYRDIPDFLHLDDIKIAFGALSAAQQQDVLQTHRTRADARIRAGYQRTRYVNEHYDADTLLSWSFIRDTLVAGLENAQDVLARHKNTAHSYAAKTIASVFGEQDRLYLPMQQFAPEQDALQSQTLVLSRHPYDLMRSATCRSWWNCMAHNGDNYASYVAADIRYGSIVCYRVGQENDDWRSTDWNIDAPLNRSLLKPYTDQKNTLLYASGYSYGESDAAGRLFRDAAATICCELFSRDAQLNTTYHIEPLHITDLQPEIIMADESVLPKHVSSRLVLT